MAKNSSRKGKTGEKYVVELLKEWWKDERFIRNWMGMSGAVGTILEGRTDIPEQLLTAMTGDIICPPEFPFSIESKFYEEIDLYEIVRNPNAVVRQFWQQVKGDAARINKIPLVIMRENRKQAYVVYRGRDFKSSFSSAGLEYSTLMFYDQGELIHIAAWNEFSKYWTKEKILEGLPQI